MPKEQQSPNSIEDNLAGYTNAEVAFFRWQYTLGSYEYARRRGSSSEARVLDAELTQRYERYRALRDHSESLYRTGGPREPSVQQLPLFICERPPFGFLVAAQEELASRGYYFLPVEREHTEGLITGPLIQRLRTHIKKRGFARVAGRALITFSCYEADRREVYEIPEARAYYRKLDSELPELPALPAYLPALGFNGPGLYLLLLGEVDQTIHRPEHAGYDVHVADAGPLIQQALARIHRACARYHLAYNQRERLAAAFLAGATHRFG
jgi:hypothetical protein